MVEDEKSGCYQSFVLSVPLTSVGRFQYKLVIQLDDDYLTNAGFLGDGESLSHCARLLLTSCRRFRVRQTDDQDHKGTPWTFRRQVSVSFPIYPTYHFVFRIDVIFVVNVKASGPDDKLAKPSSDASTLLSQLSIASDATVVTPRLISDLETVPYWNDTSMDPPELRYRSGLESNPFPVPRPGTSRWSELPVKTAEGVFGTPLNAVWHIVAPMICLTQETRR